MEEEGVGERVCGMLRLCSAQRVLLGNDSIGKTRLKSVKNGVLKRRKWVGASGLFEN